MSVWQYWDNDRQHKQNIQSLLDKAECICLKVGSSLLIDTQDRCVRQAWLSSLAEDIKVLKNQKKKLIFIASGAVACAGDRLSSESDTLVRKQARAAVGQPRLMHAFIQAFDRVGIEIAQVLFNPHDTEDRRRHLNVRGTLEELLDSGVMPIINENDTVSSLALRYGDNDRLSSRVAGMMNADLLLMFSDVDGVYDQPPNVQKDAKLIAEIQKIDTAVENLAGEAGSDVGTGGMTTKLQAASMCLDSNCHMILSSGKPYAPISKLLKEGRGTIFRAKGAPMQARKRWLAGLLQPVGTVVIDAGASRALRNGKSLLPAGICGLSETFQRGDPVAIKDQHNTLVAMGLSNYSSQELARIQGKKSADIADILGYVRENTAIHRDNLTLRS